MSQEMSNTSKFPKGSDVRLVLAALICLALFTASTDEDEWCGQCWSHERGDITFHNESPLYTLKVRILGPRRGSAALPPDSTWAMELRSGFYNYVYAFVDPADNDRFLEGGAGVFEVLPKEYQTIRINH